MQSEHIPHIKPSGRSHYEVHELQTWSDDALIAYILYTMQRKGMTEYSTALIPGYLGKKYDRPQGWHLLFWPFLGSYRHAYEWNRVFIKDGELIFELEECINKYKYDLFEDTCLEKIFPSPVGKTFGERYCPKIITHYTASEFFAMQHQLPIHNFKPMDKHRQLVDLACSIQLFNPQRAAADAAKRPPLTEAQIEALANAPILKVRPMQDILDECAGKTKFSRRLLWMLLISLVIVVPLSIYLYNHQSQIAEIGCTWWGVGLLTYGSLMVMFLVIDLFDTYL